MAGLSSKRVCVIVVDAVHKIWKDVLVIDVHFEEAAGRRL